MLDALILIAVIIAAAILMYPRLANAPTWRATITPLASIIGSGFLVLGPILDTSYGLFAPLVMAGLCVGAYFFGAAIRFNIAVLDTGGNDRSSVERGLESVASWSLAFAYIISVAYYLNLFGAFGLSLTPIDGAFHARLLTSAVLMLILVVGWFRGFSALERMEQVTVGIKLAIIAGLLLGLGVYFAKQAGKGDLIFNPPTVSGWAGLTLAFGLVVTVQGFETSRYLGKTYDAATRIRSMRIAQLIATAIYMIYAGFLAYIFEAGTVNLDETAIIGMMEVVAPVLPVLLVVAALSAQFSAAVADTSGSGGLISELTANRISPRQAYVVLVGAGLVLTWSADVFEIVSYASRAFALYYALQASIAALAARRTQSHFAKSWLFFALAAAGFLMAVLGTPVE